MRESQIDPADLEDQADPDALRAVARYLRAVHEHRQKLAAAEGAARLVEICRRAALLAGAADLGDEGDLIARATEANARASRIECARALAAARWNRQEAAR